MAKITIEGIKTSLQIRGFDLLSEEYKNLQTEMTFKCDENHTFVSTWGLLRNKIECPICKTNPLKQKTATKVVPKKKNAARILGLDQATHTSGYAIIEDDKILAYGTFEAPELDEVNRLFEIKNWFVSLIRMWQPDYIWIEGTQLQDNMGVTVFQTLNHLQGVLLVAAKEQNVPIDIVHTAVWRNYSKVKGRSRADKKQSMKNIVKEKFDISITDDCADAIGIALYGMSQYSYETGKDENKRVYKMLDW